MEERNEREKKKRTRRLGTAARAALLLLALPFALGTKACERDLDPIIFVHGGSGSGAQFETQAMRFTSNGYPASRIRVLEYDSSAISTILPDVLARLDALIAELQAETGRTQVELIGHSLGTFVSQTYLSTPARAANVAHYVNVDGRAASAPPGGVPTLALWAGAIPRSPQPEITGATNVLVPDQEHIEVAVSEESFVEMYRFFRGHPPLTSKILPEIRSQISGRVTSFPQNTGLDGATLEIWRVDGDTGERTGSGPVATYAIGADGDFGPFTAWLGKHYELAVTREGEVSLHYYYEPFLRSDHLVRLNVALGLAPFISSSDAHVALTVLRFKEFWGDRGAANDVLAIDGIDVINPTTAPSGAVGLASSAFFLFDVGSDGASNLTNVPFPFSALPFLTAADLFIPSQPPRTITVTTVPRGDAGATRVVNVPSLPSNEARVVVQLNDFEQDFH
ncbi:MAG TPA: alpha/beta hydrolase [Planctomycetota bacterium]|nr:alpha/beta hydrolase [Planctomycetota bacterium]